MCIVQRRGFVLGSCGTALVPDEVRHDEGRNGRWFRLSKGLARKSSERRVRIFFDDCYDAKGGPWAEFGPSRRDSWGPFFGPGPDQHDEHEQDDFDPTPDAWELEGSRMPRTRSRGSGGRQRQSHSRRNRELATGWPTINQSGDDGSGAAGGCSPGRGGCLRLGGG